jgi:hypothetical protein
MFPIIFEGLFEQPNDPAGSAYEACMTDFFLFDSVF